MKFGKFSVQQIIQSAVCGSFCFEVNTKSEYNHLRTVVKEVDSELVKKWDVSVSECGFPVYLNKSGLAISKLYAIQHDYYIVAFEDIEFSLPTDLNTYVCNELNKMQDHRKEQVYELVKKLAEEEVADKYWYLDSDGTIKTCFESQNVTVTKDRRSIGNYFATKSEAEFELHRRLTLKKWERIRNKIENGFSLGSHACFYPSYNIVKKKLEIECIYGSIVNSITGFSSEGNCKRAIEELGEMNVKDYILGVTKP